MMIGAGDLTQWHKCLPSKYEIVSSIPGPKKKMMELQMYLSVKPLDSVLVLGEKVLWQKIMIKKEIGYKGVNMDKPRFIKFIVLEALTDSLGIRLSKG